MAAPEPMEETSEWSGLFIPLPVAVCAFSNANDPCELKRKNSMNATALFETKENYPLLELMLEARDDAEGTER